MKPENVTAFTETLAAHMEMAMINAEGVPVSAITLPSGSWVIIREQNGEDDGIISNASLHKDASSINLFVKAIVAFSPKAKDKRGILTLEEVLDMPVRDKYVIIVKSRIFSMGNLLEFSFTWDDNEGIPDHYEENLERYIWDYSLPFPELKSPDYDPERVAAYKVFPDKDGWVYMDMTGKVSVILEELTSTPGIKKLRFKLLNGWAERKLLAMGDNGMNVNTKLLTRELQLLVGDNWLKVETFKSFKSPEMAILRKAVADYDQEFDGNTEVTNPRTDAIQIVPLMAIANFFFPQGT
jgi:hypothetical protein